MDVPSYQLQASPHPLIDAASAGDRQTLLRLIEAGSDINERDQFGRTALMLAARWGWRGVVRSLLCRNAEVMAADDSGCTALRCARQWQQHEVVRILEEHHKKKPKITTRKKSTASRRRTGAESFRFELSPGGGEVDMATFVSGRRRALVSLNQSTVAAVKAATGGEKWTAATGALAAWALEELKRQGRRLTVSDADIVDPRDKGFWTSDV